MTSTRRSGHWSGLVRSLSFSIVVLGGTLLVGMPASAAPPSNDAFANAIEVPALPFENTVATAQASRETGEPRPSCAPIGRTIWYQYTPSTDTVLGANTAGSNFDTVLGVYTGSSLADLSEVRCADDGIFFDSQARVAFLGTASTTYYFQVGGYRGASGSLRFTLREIEAGFIAGTVTEDETSVPLAEICVSVMDADLDLTWHLEVTDAAGQYIVPARTGSYVVAFGDCSRSFNHRSEWYDDVPSQEAALLVEVQAPDVTDNINAGLQRTCPGWGDFTGPQHLGTSGPETLIGGPAAEVFCGLGGADRLIGRGGRDFIAGGPGNDELLGGDGRDELRGEAGNDLLAGGAKVDFCSGGTGRDRARGCEATRSVP